MPSAERGNERVGSVRFSRFRWWFTSVRGSLFNGAQQLLRRSSFVTGVDGLCDLTQRSFIRSLRSVFCAGWNVSCCVVVMARGREADLASSCGTLPSLHASPIPLFMAARTVSE